MAKTKPDLSNRFVIIMAGGKGERFWPVSREKSPKQPASPTVQVHRDPIRVAAGGLHVSHAIPTLIHSRHCLLGELLGFGTIA